VVTRLILAVLGLGVAAGVFGITWAVRPRRWFQRDPDLTARKRPHTESRNDTWAFSPRGRKVAVSIATGLLCAVITRWPVAAILGALAAWTLPSSLRRVIPGEGSKRAEAVATWAELVRDSLAASAGLAQAIVVTASSAPIPLRPQVTAMATRLANGFALENALRTFAIELDDPAADFLVCALLLAATSRAQRLVDVLSALCDSIREDVSMHLRVDASRASARSSVRTVVLFSVVFAGALAVLARSYLSPFGSPVGQMVLGAVGLLYVVGLGLMVRLVRPRSETRLLDAGRIG
jgi:tight adherence protein B